jgi:RNA polymerase sigma-70 factor (ECF subfamily)
VTGAAYPDWNAIYRDNVTWVYRLMYGKVGNQPDAEDLTALGRRGPFSLVITG